MVVGQLGRSIAPTFLLTLSSVISQIPILAVLHWGTRCLNLHSTMMPLTAISTSLPESLAGSVCSEWITSEEYEYRTTYDSIMDSCTKPQKTTVENSIFEKTGYHTSVSSSDSMFFGKNSDGHNPPHYCPISSFGIASSHRPVKEHDTMISVSVSTIYKNTSDSHVDAGWRPCSTPFCWVHD